MRVALFQAVRQQYGFCCGYCGLSETDAGATLTIDHFYPRIQGGGDDFPNLVYSCHACNEHKADYWNPGAVERILHPLNDDMALHIFVNEALEFVPLSETGAFHIRRLQLNRPALIAFRRQKRETEQDRKERQEGLALLRQMAADVAALTVAIEKLRSGGE